MGLLADGDQWEVAAVNNSNDETVLLSDSMPFLYMFKGNFIVELTNHRAAKIYCGTVSCWRSMGSRCCK